MNKLLSRGAEKVLSVYWFLIITIVAMGMVYIVFQFYGEPYDVRAIESEILSQQIANCLVQENYLKPEVLSLTEGGINQNNFLQKCHFNLDTGISSLDNSLGGYYVNVEIFNFVLDSESKIVLSNPLKSISIGESRLLEQDLFENSPRFFYVPDRTKEQSKIKYEIEKNKLFYVLDNEKNPYVIRIFTLVGKSEKNK